MYFSNTQMLSSTYLLIFVNIFVQSVSSQPGGRRYELTCMEREFLECKDTIGFNWSEVTKTYVMTMTLPNETFLDEHCENFVKIFDCYARKVELCNSTNTDYANIKDLFEELCEKDSEIRKAYNANFECLNGNMEDMRRCAVKAWSFASSRFESSNLSEEDNRKRFCLDKYATEEKCILGIPKEKCDESLYPIMKRILQKMKSREMCSNEIMTSIADEFGTQVQDWNWQETI